MQDSHSPDARAPASRRTFFFGAATAGAAAVAATALPGVQPAAPVAESVKRTPPEKGGGYQLSEHVKHYYRTTSL